VCRNADVRGWPDWVRSGPSRSHLHYSAIAIRELAAPEAAFGSNLARNFGGDLVKLLRSNVAPNLWYTKAALDHLIFNELQEWASPGYLDRMQERAEKTYGQSYWWKPDEVVPSAAPDATTAIQY
jgi:hypothetical protein